jgi:Co/Zn/Cd efflux system component
MRRSEPLVLANNTDCADDCCASAKPSDIKTAEDEGRWRRTLWVVLAINAVMFAVEIVAGLMARSASMQVDALDFFGDAANYALSLGVLGMSLRVRATAALAKGVTMGAFGVWVLGLAAWQMANGVVPVAHTMGTIGVLALVANVACLAMLTGFRTGDANMRSVWICSRNDVIGNIAVLAAAAGVLGTGSGWPDATVAAVMGVLALSGSWQVLRQAHTEMKQA